MSQVKVQGNASGTGALTIAAPNTNSNYTLTLPTNTGTLVSTGSTGVVTSTMLATGTAGTGPLFRAYPSGTITLSAGVATKIALNNETYDTASCFDTTLYRFTPNVAGYYQINLGLSGGQTASSLTSTYPMLYKNGVVFASGGRQQSTGQPANCSWSGIVYLNGSTDYIEMYAITNSAAFGVSTGTDSTSLTQMSGFLARAA